MIFSREVHQEELYIDLLFEIIRLGLGVWCGYMAICFGTLTIRVWRNARADNVQRFHLGLLEARNTLNRNR